MTLQGQNLGEQSTPRVAETEETRSQREERQYYSAVYWAGVLIWAGVIFLAERLNYLPQIGAADGWTWVFLGAGLFALFGNLWRSSSPKRVNPTTWDYLWAAILIIIGLGGFTTLEITWPLILLLVGVVMLGGTLWPRDQ